MQEHDRETTAAGAVRQVGPDDKVSPQGISPGDPTPSGRKEQQLCYNIHDAKEKPQRPQLKKCTNARHAEDCYWKFFHVLCALVAGWGLDAAVLRKLSTYLQQICMQALIAREF